MFNKRHEQELAEIKALTLGLGQAVQEVLERLEGIKAAQERLGTQAASGPEPRLATAADDVTGAQPGAEDPPGKAGRRKSARRGAGAAKKGRGRQAPSTVLGAAGKSGKRGRVTSVGTSGDSSGAGAGRKQRAAGGKRRQTEPARRSGSDRR